MAKASQIALDFAEAIDSKIVQQAPLSYTGVGVLGGQKFDKIVLMDVNGPKSVHAFVERKTGFLIKAASWNAPAKGVNGLAVRYCLLDGEFDAAVADAEYTGGYLYEGRQTSLMNRQLVGVFEEQPTTDFEF